MVFKLVDDLVEVIDRLPISHVFLGSLYKGCISVEYSTFLVEMGSSNEDLAKWYGFITYCKYKFRSINQQAEWQQQY